MKEEGNELNHVNILGTQVSSKDLSHPSLSPVFQHQCYPPSPNGKSHGLSLRKRGFKGEREVCFIYRKVLKDRDLVLFIFVWSRVGTEPQYTVRAQYMFVEQSYTPPESWLGMG